MEQVTKILAAIAVPLVLAWVGTGVQDKIAERNLQRDYVQIAVSILSDSTRKTSAALKSWAVDLVNANAPVRLSDSARQELVTGAATLPATTVQPSNAGEHSDVLKSTIFLRTAKGLFRAEIKQAGGRVYYGPIPGPQGRGGPQLDSIVCNGSRARSLSALDRLILVGCDDGTLIVVNVETRSETTVHLQARLAVVSFEISSDLQGEVIVIQGDPKVAGIGVIAGISSYCRFFVGDPPSALCR
jgi:hypothetical protein